MYRGFTGTFFVFASMALAGQARAATISSFGISTTAGLQGANPCFMSGSGPGTASCRSTTPLGSSPLGDASASVTVTDNSIQLNVDAFQVSGAQGFASITHDDFYSVPVNGPVSALLSLTCNNAPPGTAGHFSLGSTNVSPGVESIYMGASQGSGPCGHQIQFRPLPPSFVVSLVAANNIVHLQTYIDAIGGEGDNISGIFVQLTVNGFQDANGNPITATLMPEPGTWLTLGLGLLIVAGMKHVSKYTLIRNHERRNFT